VPFNTQSEWQSFYTAAYNASNPGTPYKVPGVVLSHCSRPMTQPVTLTPSAACLNPDPASATAQEPNYYPYTTNDAVQWTTSASFNCYPDGASNPSTKWVQTVTQVYGGLNGDVLQPDGKTWAINSNPNASWEILSTNYSGGGDSPVNGACSGAAKACNAGTLVDTSVSVSSDGKTVTWTCAGSSGGTDTSCSAVVVPSPPESCVLMWQFEDGDMMAVGSPSCLDSPPVSLDAGICTVSAEVACPIDECEDPSLGYNIITADYLAVWSCPPGLSPPSSY
jgi:hypothetical protein